jgi:hypothetical protein
MIGTYWKFDNTPRMAFKVTAEREDPPQFDELGRAWWCLYSWGSEWEYGIYIRGLIQITEQEYLLINKII